MITQMDMTIINAMSMRNTVVSNGFKTIQTIILVENSKPLARILAAVSHLHTAVKSYAKVRNNRYFFLTPYFTTLNGIVSFRYYHTNRMC